MYRLNPGCRTCSPGPRLCPRPHHSGSPSSGAPDHQGEKEEEEEAGATPAACCYTAGCSDVIGRAVKAQRPSFESPAHTEDPSGSGPAGPGPSRLARQQPQSLVAADRGSARHCTGGCFGDGPETETRSGACAHGQRRPRCAGRCWPGSPYICYGVRRSLVVGVEVLEEVAVEDTVELVTEDVYADEDLLDDSELLHENRLYST